MATLKWRTSKGWVEFFKEISDNVLFKNKNLADLTDRKEALKNLGLTGDVTTHNHDSLYNAKIEKLNNELSKKIKELSTEIDEIKSSNESGSSSIQSQIDTINKNMESKMNNSRIIISATEPQSKNVGDIWFCTKTGSRLISTWNGTQWEHYSAIWE